jgi:hypothetical protein
MFTWSGTLNYYVLADAAGSPIGPPLYSGSTTATRTPDPIPDCCGYDEMRYSFAFVPALQLQPGVRYWLAINLPGGGSFGTTQAFWSDTPTPFGGLGGTAKITSDPTFMSWGSYDMNLAFRLMNDSADTTPPVISVPDPITTYATSPSGAVVSYTVTANDPDDAVASLNCAPSSGSTFPAGTTTVNCTATDTHGNASSASFTVHVKDAAEQLADLLASVAQVSSLAKKVSQAQAYVAAGHPSDACVPLQKFIKQVRAESGRDFPLAQAAALIASAQQIKAVIGC